MKTELMSEIEIVRRGYQAFNEADVETLVELMADDVTWTTPGESTVAGTASGRDAVLTQFGRYGGETDGTFKADLEGVFGGDGRRVIALHHNSATRAGRTLDTDCCIVFEVENGKIASGTEHILDLYNWDKFWS